MVIYFLHHNLTIWLLVWLQLVLISAAYELNPAIRCSQQPDHRCVSDKWHWSLYSTRDVQMEMCSS